MSSVAGLVAILVLIFIGVLGLSKKAAGITLPGTGGGSGTTPAKYPYADLINKWASHYGVDPDLVAAHMKTESSFNPEAVNLEDPSIDWDSSYGLLQVQLATAQDFGAVKDYKNATPAEVAWLMVPSNNIKVGTWNIARWQKRYPFDIAVQMYNVGERGYNVLGRRNYAYLSAVKGAYNGYNAS